MFRKCRFVRNFLCFTMPLTIVQVSSTEFALAQALGGFVKNPFGGGGIPKSLGCAAGALGGSELGKKLADLEAKRLNLSPAAAAAQRRKFEIGLALALCGGGQAIAGTTYARLSKKGQQERNNEFQSALMDETPEAHMYKDPDNPQLAGKLTAEAPTTDGDRQCRVIEDTLADGSQSDSALIKYCRVPPDGSWKVQTV
jgi:surface antigen